MAAVVLSVQKLAYKSIVRRWLGYSVDGYRAQKSATSWREQNVWQDYILCDNHGQCERLSQCGPPTGTGTNYVLLILARLANPEEEWTWWKRSMVYGLFCHKRYVHAKQIIWFVIPKMKLGRALQRRRLVTIVLKNRKARKTHNQFFHKGSHTCHSWCVEESKLVLKWRNSSF